MSDLEGKFRISYYSTDANGIRSQVILDVGSVTNLTQNITKATSTIPLVSMGADRAFQLETGNTMQYTISFKRKNPVNHDNTSADSTQWSNRKWYDEMTKLVDRWQMKTDGCRMTYKPEITNPYVPAIDVNGYIKMLTRNYTSKYNELIEGSIQFIVGTIYTMKSPKAQPEQRTYIPLFLDCGVNGETEEQTKELRTKYALNGIVYTVESRNGTINLPDMPPLWGGYSTYKGLMLKKWTLTYVYNTGVIQTPSMSHDQPGGEISINVPDNCRLVLTAGWGK